MAASGDFSEAAEESSLPRRRLNSKPQKRGAGVRNSTPIRCPLCRRARPRYTTRHSCSSNVSGLVNDQHLAVVDLMLQHQQAAVRVDHHGLASLAEFLAVVRAALCLHPHLVKYPPAAPGRGNSEFAHSPHVHRTRYAVNLSFRTGVPESQPPGEDLMDVWLINSAHPRDGSLHPVKAGTRAAS